ncbi:MAG: SOS response-associated peptidase [Rhodospirillaceae bacterium]
MCARYEIKASKQKIIERFGPITNPLSLGDFQTKNEVSPTDKVPIIGFGGTSTLLQWGISVDWQVQPIINARIETLTEKPTFRPLLEQRILIPATAYFEWRKEGKLKIKTRIALKDSDLFAIAGIRQREHCVILTCASCSSVQHIHNRMPVLLSSSLESEWLNTDRPFHALAHKLKPYSGPLEYTETGTEQNLHRDLFHQT